MIRTHRQNCPIKLMGDDAKTDKKSPIWQKRTAD